MAVMRNELVSIATNQVRELVDLPIARKPISKIGSSRSNVRQMDLIDKYKARLMVKLYMQREGINCSKIL